MVFRFQLQVFTLFSFLLLGLGDALQAQNCTPDLILLDSQEKVDNFQANHGPCDHVLGDLAIEGPDITNIDALSTLISVSGTLTIKNNPNLININGISNLESVGGNLFLENNGELKGLDGLVRLQDVGEGLFIFRNEALEQINGLRSLATVEGHFYISLNPSLESIDGLSTLERVGNWLRFWRNERLADINGFNGLQEIGIGLDFDGNSSLISINGFTSLAEPLPQLLIQRNSSLARIDGLSKLEWAGSLLVFRNPSLVEFHGLASLQNTGSLTVAENSALADLNELSKLREAYSISVADNMNLRDCQGLTVLVDPVDDYEPGPGPGAAAIPDVAESVNIQNNAEGCNSVNELLSEVPIHEMNAGLNDAWFNFDTDGQGFLITVFPEIRQVFMAWFTYDTERPSDDVTAILGEPGHRWLTAQGEYTDNVAELTLYITEGGVFGSAEPKPETLPYGELLIEFTTCNAGHVAYDIPSIVLQGDVPIERVALDNVPLCYLLNKQTMDSEQLQGFTNKE